MQCSQFFVFLASAILLVAMVNFAEARGLGRTQQVRMPDGLLKGFERVNDNEGLSDYSPRIDNNNMDVPHRDFVDTRSTVVDCGFYYLWPGDSVIVQSPGFPVPYWPGSFCSWGFTAIDSVGISMTCDTFRVTASTNCLWSYVYIHDSYNYDWLCGNHDGYDIFTTDNTLAIYFNTYYQMPGSEGFQCTVSALAYTDSTTEAVIDTTPEAVIDTTPEAVIDTTPEAVTDTTPSDCKCGVANTVTRVVGGTPTDVHEYPWVVVIYINSLNEPLSTSPNCGGSIINEYWVLTAAHCTSDLTSTRMRVAIAEYDWTTESETVIPTDFREIVEAIQHEDYEEFPEHVENDIAIIRVAFPIDLREDNLVAPICPPTRDGNFDNMDVVVAGWGLLSFGGVENPSELHAVSMATLSNEKCKQMGYPPEIILSNMICAGVPEGGKDSCKGDSGSSLMGKEGENNHFSLIGVASFGEGCGDPNHPGVYTRVSEFLDWIERHVNGTKSCSPPAAARIGIPFPV